MRGGVAVSVGRGEDDAGHFLAVAGVAVEGLHLDVQRIADHQTMRRDPVADRLGADEGRVVRNGPGWRIGRVDIVAERGGVRAEARLARIGLADALGDREQVHDVGQNASGRVIALARDAERGGRQAVRIGD